MKIIHVLFLGKARMGLSSEEFGLESGEYAVYAFCDGCTSSETITIANEFLGCMDMTACNFSSMLILTMVHVLTQKLILIVMVTVL